MEKCKSQQPDGNCKKDAESCLEDCKRDCKEGKKDPDNLFTAMERAYDKGANNCFVAALLYLASVAHHSKGACIFPPSRWGWWSDTWLG